MGIELEAAINALREQNHPYFGIIKNIIPAAQLGADGNEPVAIIEHVVNGEKTEDWLPLNPKRFPEIGSQVFVDPKITQVGKGFSVTFSIVI